MTILAILGNKGGDVLTIKADATARDVVALLAERKIGAAPVIDNGQIVGMLSERDVINCLNQDGGAILDWPASRLMSSPAVTISTDTAVLSALALMTKRRIRHLPVVESGQLRGIVSIGDLVKYRIDSIEQEAEAMRAYIQAV